ncbi:hypothetical protein CVT26_000191 [Gymnopilus dilepis]|uniref:DUF952 domain-containing protein n=1 Tax=Gymnopilus dilepis TaxID=231916 RepID=A0A409VG35_9AGAR|nr:hypothetical protein CVT26_000191 [Gymnopilus dilepis]
MSTPTYIYKIVPVSSGLPDPIPESLPVSELDKKDNFIHLSTAAQLPGTLDRFFPDHEQVHILRIAYKNVEKDIKWENSKGTAPGGVGEEGIFPHLHNGLRLGCNEIESVATWKKDPDWASAVNKAKDINWFIY